MHYTYKPNEEILVRNLTTSYFTIFSCCRIFANIELWTEGGLGGGVGVFMAVFVSFPDKLS